MPRGMDERFEDPSASTDERTGESSGTTDDEAEGEGETTPEAQSSGTERDDQLNIREDWDSATIYVEPTQSEDIDVTFTRLKKQLKREGYVLEKNKHFYRAVFEVAFEAHPEETKERIRALAQSDDGESRSR
ncbi:hypothetical protein [Halomarina ordinaria]|uniref:DUF8160 domain-containing protein n=1 Tax=Halomarina ordinaria TaxID=3033939 RepID=A0ABD5UGZ1_9EURY|nr:hypothetical protein [Halomarina sp. PSRA2]